MTHPPPRYMDKKNTRPAIAKASALSHPKGLSALILPTLV